jgi:hypothetical protein
VGLENGIEMKQSLRWQKGFSVLRHKAAGALLILTLSGFAACSSNQLDKSRAEVFKQYETMVRWSQWDAAAEFIAPEYLEQHPITRLEMERLRLFRVTQYTLRFSGIFDEGKTARQTVEISMFNANQAVERTIVDEQEWRYNPTTKQWRLYSGLPDPTKRQ